MQNQSDTLAEFYYDTDAKLTFSNWFACYEDLFIVDLKEQVDDWQVTLLLRKLGSAEHDRYSNYILPKHPWDYNFTETVEILKIFGECTSHFDIHFNCLNITKCDALYFMTYASTVNKKCKQFKISSIMYAQFKCLICKWVVVHR